MKTNNNTEGVLEQIIQLKEENYLLRSLATRSGFFEFYFKELGRLLESGRPVHRTNYECFEYVNQKYYDLFGEYKFSNMNSFRGSYSNYLEEKKK